MGCSTSQSQPELLMSNVYIFNKIKNNNKDVELLQKTFENLKCVVTEIQVSNKKYAELKDVVKGIVTGDFTNFNYIVIIILDNENEDEYVWVTQDNKNFHLNGDLITAIHANKSLEGKLRFTIFQTNRVSSEDIKKREIRPQKCYSGKDVRYFATSTGCVLKKWDDGQTSPFIKHLCDVIDQNISLQPSDQLTIDKMLDEISRRVSNETDECPTKTSLYEPYVLRNAT